MKKRILSAVLAGLVSTSAIGALSGCGIGGGGVEVDAG